MGKKENVLLKKNNYCVYVLWFNFESRLSSGVEFLSLQTKGSFAFLSLTQIKKRKGLEHKSSTLLSRFSSSEYSLFLSLDICIFGFKVLKLSNEALCLLLWVMSGFETLLLPLDAAVLEFYSFIYSSIYGFRCFLVAIYAFCSDFGS